MNKYCGIVLVLVISYISLSSAIIDGIEAEAHSLPYMVSITTVINGITVRCGGSLISKYLVLTAAKCLYGATEAKVTLGAHNLDSADEEGHIIQTSKAFTIHEDYDPASLFNDIAIIELPEAVTLTDKVNIVQLPDVTDIANTYDEREGLIAGWGKINDTTQAFSEVLRYQNLTIIPFLMCDLSYLLQVHLTQLCTSGVSKKNICLGDAGSPLVVDGVQVGIASYGSEWGCAIGSPAVYTRITSYLSWLLL